MKITAIGKGTLPNRGIPTAQAEDAGHPVHVAVSITPETALECRLLADPRLQAGLDWGTPRFGHPEGRVRAHVAAMLAAIPSDDPLRNDLRFLALLHDSFKSEVQPDQPWSAENDHAMLARRFAARYTTDEQLLTTLQLHDEPYWIWQNSQTPEKALRPLLKQLPDLRAVRALRRARRRQRRQRPHLPVVVPQRARNPRTAPETAYERTGRRDRRHRLREGLRHHTPTTAGSRKRRPGTHHRAKHQDAGRSGGAHQRRRTPRPALVALARITPRATRPRRRRRARSARLPPDLRPHSDNRSADLPHRHRHVMSATQTRILIVDDDSQVRPDMTNKEPTT